MSRTAVKDLMDQYQRSFRMLTDEMHRFDETQWVTGLGFFQVPCKVAMHIVDCLDYYFSGKGSDGYTWGHRFGGGWWELADDQLPAAGEVMTYAAEIEARVVQELDSLEDDDLAGPVRIEDGSGATMLGHYVYALRHTMHHHGELSTLAIYHGVEGGSWA